MRLGQEKIERGGNVGLQVFAVYHGVEKSVFQQKL
jgi:hypothetical protein